MSRILLRQTQLPRPTNYRSSAAASVSALDDTFALESPRAEDGLAPETIASVTRHVVRGTGTLSGQTPTRLGLPLIASFDGGSMSQVTGTGLRLVTYHGGGRVKLTQADLFGTKTASAT